MYSPNLNRVILMVLKHYDIVEDKTFLGRLKKRFIKTETVGGLIIKHIESGNFKYEGANIEGGDGISFKFSINGFPFRIIRENILKDSPIIYMGSNYYLNLPLCGHNLEQITKSELRKIHSLLLEHLNSIIQG